MSLYESFLEHTDDEDPYLSLAAGFSIVFMAAPVAGEALIEWAIDFFGDDEGQAFLEYIHHLAFDDVFLRNVIEYYEGGDVWF